MKISSRPLPFEMRKLNLKSPENVQEHLFVSAINRTRNLSCACVSACDRTRYMTGPVNQCASEDWN